MKYRNKKKHNFVLHFINETYFKVENTYYSGSDTKSKALITSSSKVSGINPLSVMKQKNC